MSHHLYNLIQSMVWLTQKVIFKFPLLYENNTFLRISSSKNDPAIGKQRVALLHKMKANGDHNCPWSLSTFIIRKTAA